jgi:hypothetical protein
MTRFRRNLSDLEAEGLDFPALDSDLFRSHAERHYEDPSSGNRYGVDQVSANSGETRFEIGELDGEIYVEMRNPSVDNMDAYGEKIFDGKIRPQIMRNVHLLMAADAYAGIVSELSGKTGNSLEAIVESELEETQDKTGQEVLERPETFLEQSFAYFMEGEGSEHIDSDYEDAGRYFHAYKDRVLNILDEKDADIGELWLQHAS